MRPVKVNLLGADVPPYSWVQDQRVIGINIEIAEQAARALGYQTHSRIVPLKRAFHMLKHRPDHFFVGLARTPEREQSFTWIAPLISTRIGMFAWQATQQSSRKQRAEICVHIGTPMENWLKTNSRSDYVTVTNEQACLKLLVEGLVQYWLTEANLVQYLLKQNGLSSTGLVEGEVIMQPQLYLAASLDTSEILITTWRQQLQDMAATGDISEIVDRYINDQYLGQQP